MRWLLACGLISSLSWADPGFFLPGDNRLPADMSAVSSSVYRLILLKDEAWSVSMDSYETQIKEIRQKRAPGYLTEFVVSLLEQCLTEQRARCDLPAIKGQGTAFLAGDAQSLWTVRHNFHNELAAAWVRGGDGDRRGRYQSGLKAHLNFILTDANNHVVYDTRRIEDAAALEFYGEPALRGDTIENYRPYDVARIRLARPLGPSYLEFETTPPFFGTTAFIVGFPAATQKRFEKYGVPDSDGRSLFASQGHIISISLESEDLPPLSPINDLPFFQTAFVFFDIDAVWGNSGSPVLNTAGKVVSIFAAHQSLVFLDGQGRPDLDYSPAGGQGLSVSWIRQLETLARGESGK